MNKNVLIIGGSYFLGRVFTLFALQNKNYNLHVLNRGTYPFQNPAVTELVCDRKDAFALQGLPVMHFDAIVDFCAYDPGDIQLLIHSAPISAAQYIYISSASVYIDSDSPKDESFPLRTKAAQNQGSIYAYHKRLLEDETIYCCNRGSMVYTIFRPCYVYGPYNYAPRESFFLERLFHMRSIPRPVDASADFSMVYVTDIAKAICGAIDAPIATNKIYNLAAPERINYDFLFQTFSQIHPHDIQYEDYTVEGITDNHIPLPYPLVQNDLYNGQKAAQELSFEYTPFLSGMQHTYQAFRPVYTTTTNTK